MELVHQCQAVRVRNRLRDFCPIERRRLRRRRVKRRVDDAQQVVVGQDRRLVSSLPGLLPRELDEALLKREHGVLESRRKALVRFPERRAGTEKRIGGRVAALLHLQAPLRKLAEEVGRNSKSRLSEEVIELRQPAVFDGLCFVVRAAQILVGEQDLRDLASLGGPGLSRRPFQPQEIAHVLLVDFLFLGAEQLGPRCHGESRQLGQMLAVDVLGLESAQEPVGFLVELSRPEVDRELCKHRRRVFGDLVVEVDSEQERIVLEQPLTKAVDRGDRRPVHLPERSAQPLFGLASAEARKGFGHDAVQQIAIGRRLVEHADRRENALAGAHPQLRSRCLGIGHDQDLLGGQVALEQGAHEVRRDRVGLPGSRAGLDQAGCIERDELRRQAAHPSLRCSKSGS